MQWDRRLPCQTAAINSLPSCSLRGTCSGLPPGAAPGLAGSVLAPHGLLCRRGRWAVSQSARALDGAQEASAKVVCILLPVPEDGKEKLPGGGDVLRGCQQAQASLATKAPPYQSGELLSKHAEAGASHVAFLHWLCSIGSYLAPLLSSHLGEDLALAQKVPHCMHGLARAMLPQSRDIASHRPSGMAPLSLERNVLYKLDRARW